MRRQRHCLSPPLHNTGAYFGDLHWFTARMAGSAAGVHRKAVRSIKLSSLYNWRALPKVNNSDMTTELSAVNEQEQSAIVTVCILAAFADGAQNETERAEIKRIIENFTGEGSDLTFAYQQTLGGKRSLSDVAKTIQSTNGKALAYEMAVCICRVDGAMNPAEQSFLETLRQALDIQQGTAANFQTAATSIAAAPMAEPPVINAPTQRDVELDKMILNRAILAGGLELMPQTLATMAIVPVQM